MQLTTFRSAADFRARAEAFLGAHEAHHNLLFGISAALMVNPNLYPSQPYFAVVESDSGVVAAALMTPPHKPVLSVCEAHAALGLIAKDLYATYKTLPGVMGPSETARPFSELWRALTGQQYEKSVAQRIYQLTNVNPVPAPPGAIRPVAEADRTLVQQWLTEFQQEAFGEVDLSAVERSLNNLFTSPPELRGMCLWQDGEPVSMAGYTGPTPNGIRVGPVYTPPHFRGRGYATACVAALSQWLLNEGRNFCFLFTDLANPTSNHIYQVIGYEPVCDVDEYRFNFRSES